MTIPTALDLARLSELAYKDDNTVKEKLPDYDVTFVNRQDSQAYVIESEAGTKVVFRGTQVTQNFSMRDVIRNFMIKPVEYRGAKVHEGYLEAVMAIIDEIQKIVIQAKRPLTFTGHSLGGAMADLASTMSPTPNMTMTFGAPKVGNAEYARLFSGIPTLLLRYTHARDIAPKHPRQSFGYRHRGTWLHIARSGEVTKRTWRWYHDLIIPGPAGLAVGTLDHRIGQYVGALAGAQI